ncbi:primosomal protein N' [Paucilactobacillus nenjiangensis]|uniref:Replication restart protein PriA n=1 Tax=Paucilactobacillus nenjiangensis TaxID=1296540 RepID=A0A5P1X372_9LACO|nr:primosomal protein N' [Paucilactobacillus nenjiangensis]QER67354.1 primosomal protein N' [Paucilactobacillus nenjiangensis]
MAEIAQIIVDVPTMQTNRPYTYQVPEQLEHQIQTGMRVVVPFGNGSRQVQGFVVGLDDQTAYDGELKSIISILDLNPVLNQELLTMSQWLADSCYAFRISCMHTMLPNVMKTKTHRRLKIIDELDETDLFELFHGQDEIDFEPENMPDEIVSRLLKLKRNQQIEVVYSLTDQAKSKFATGIKPLLSFERLEEERTSLRKTAKAQSELLSYLQSMIGSEIKLSEAREQTGLSNAIFSTGEKKGWLEKIQIETFRTPKALLNDAKKPIPELTADQQTAVDAICDSIQSTDPQTFLLQGVTGSGKTEVYLRSIAETLANNQTALMLVPEISLTPQMVTRVKSRFGDLVAVLHSGLSNGERYDEWRRIERGEAKVVVGARSAVFAPLENIGLIIMDEEHESSYKQDETPRYHARNVAKWRSDYYGATVVLGSATPSLESRARAQKGVYQHLLLPERINQQPLPAVQVVDMRQELRKHAESNFSTELLDEIQIRMSRGEQSILMLNRRGYSSFIMCRDCGFVLQCPNCDISLTLHMDTHTMKCHYCGHEEPIPKICPNCQSHKIRYYGTGTQKVQEELQAIIPDAKILRMDVDTTRRKGMHEKLLNSFGNQEADILIGTQMIAKGLDFPNVTLVGVLNGDTALGLPDFRSSERTFQLLTQVSGRAGRADKTGSVIVQTFNPDHYAIKLAQHHDYEHFFQMEMNIRHRGKYPPYFYTLQISVSHEEEAQAAKAIMNIAQFLKPNLDKNSIVLGPTPKSIARMNRKYYYQLVIKYKQDTRLHQLLTQMMDQIQKQSRHGVQISIDPEPQNFI